MQSEKSQTVPRKLAGGPFLAGISIRFARICVDPRWFGGAGTQVRRASATGIETVFLCSFCLGKCVQRYLADRVKGFPSILFSAPSFVSIPKIFVFLPQPSISRENPRVKASRVKRKERLECNFLGVNCTIARYVRAILRRLDFRC